MKQNETDSGQYSSAVLCCKTCDYSTSRKSQMERHLATPRHIMKQNETQIGTIATDKFYDCNCGDSFNSRTTLWRHKKKCIIIQQPVTPQNIIVNISDLQNDHIKQQQLVEYLLKENSEFKQLMIDQNKHMMEQMNEQNKQYSEAIKFRRMIEKIDPWNSDNYLGLGLNSKAILDYESMSLMLDKILMISPQHPIAAFARDQLKP